MSSARKVDTELLKTMPLPDWDEDTSKASRGKLLIIGGSRRLPGAAVLAARAALRIGCGTVRLAAPESITTQIGVAIPELMVLPLAETSKGTIAASAAAKLLKEQMKACSAIVLGPGIDEDKDTEKAVRELLADASLPMVVDAQVDTMILRNSEALSKLYASVQALFAYDPKQKPKFPRILTPHVDEFKALNNGEEVDMNQSESIAENFSRQSGAVLVFKGQETVIAGPDGSLYRNEAGSRALGTAGSGDTLAGIIGGLLAQGMDPTAAAVWGVYFHAVAGERLGKEIGEDGVMATDFVERLPRLQRELRQATSSKKPRNS